MELLCSTNAVPVVGSSRTPGLPLSQKYMRRLASVQADPVLAFAAGDPCQLFTPNKRLWTGSLRGEALTSAGGIGSLRESDSLAQGRTRTPDARPRCDLANIRLEREGKARDLVLVTPRERNSDCPCRRVH